MSTFFKPLTGNIEFRSTLLCIMVLFVGCQQIQNTEQQPSDPLAAERQQLEQQRKELTELHQELDAKLALLDTEKKLVADSLVRLEQERRKLEVINKPVLPDIVPAKKSEVLTAAKPEIESLVIGQLEYVKLIPPDIQLTARIDTGARTSSLNAIDLTEFERDGKPYARFSIIDPETGKPVELVRQIRRHARIKEHESESQVRPVVKMRVILGNIDQRVNFTLIDRSNFRHQILIGRNFLRDFAVVDVSQRFTTKPKAP